MFLQQVLLDGCVNLFPQSLQLLGQLRQLLIDLHVTVPSIVATRSSKTTVELLLVILMLHDQYKAHARTK